MDNNILVFAILGVAFVAVGIHLFLYSRRVSRRIRRYAEGRGLSYRPRDDEGLETTINDNFEIPEKGLTQNFGRLRDTVRFDDSVLFRAVELLDLNPWGSAANPHAARVAVLFDLDGAPDGIFTISPSLAVNRRYPLEGTDQSGRLAELLRTPAVEPPPHPLTISLRNGRAIAYLEPLVAGSVKETHLDYLTALPGRLQKAV